MSASTNFVLGLLRVHPRSARGITEEEIRALIKQAIVTGDVEPVEQEIVEQVFWLGDRRVSGIKTPRHEIEWLDIRDGVTGIREHVATVTHPRILVCDGELDKVLGVARAEQLLERVLAGDSVDLRPLLVPPIFVPATMSVSHLVETLRSSRTHLALVLDGPRQPGQEHPGLGLLRDFMGWLVVVCETHGLDGIYFVAAPYHVAMQSRRLVRPIDPGDGARLRALADSLAGLTLPEATRAVEQGLVEDALGTPVAWKPVATVLPVSERLRELVGGPGYEQAVAPETARLAYRLRLPQAPRPPVRSRRRVSRG